MAKDYQPPAGYEEVVPGYHDFQSDEVVEGVLVEKEEGVGDNNSMRYTIERKDNNNQVMFWGSTVLDSRMKPIAPGEEIVVWYQGLKPSNQRKGASYHDWKVFRNKQTTPKPLTKTDLEEVFGE